MVYSHKAKNYGGEIVTTHESVAIAEVRESATIEEQAANARLIAAAPDLVAALEKLAGTAAVAAMNPNCPPVIAARAAIAKARGESV